MAGAVDRPIPGQQLETGVLEHGVEIRRGEGIAESRGLACADRTRTAAQS